MGRPIPVANDLTKPFWEAANQKKLVVQKCDNCGKLQYPPAQVCGSCRADKEKLKWTEVAGKGHVDVGFTIRDSRIKGYREMQPINFAVITLDQEPLLNFLSNLPGTPAGTIPVGAAVEVIFEPVSPTQLIPEWRVVAAK